MRKMDLEKVDVKIENGKIQFWLRPDEQMRASLKDFDSLSRIKNGFGDPIFEDSFFEMFRKMPKPILTLVRANKPIPLSEERCVVLDGDLMMKP